MDGVGETFQPVNHIGFFQLEHFRFFGRCWTGEVGELKRQTLVIAISSGFEQVAIDRAFPTFGALAVEHDDDVALREHFLPGMVEGRGITVEQGYFDFEALGHERFSQGQNRFAVGLITDEVNQLSALLSLGFWRLDFFGFLQSTMNRGLEVLQVTCDEVGAELSFGV